MAVDSMRHAANQRVLVGDLAKFRQQLSDPDSRHVRFTCARKRPGVAASRSGLGSNVSVCGGPPANQT